ncbi:hypothetical protein CW304_30870 [Bacillus sp. UFRGS-B20]|nr:hypothetical protein CW304_30870 [Bacillus sp. UFRGS-B20]
MSRRQVHKDGYYPWQMRIVQKRPRSGKLVSPFKRLRVDKSLVNRFCPTVGKEVGYRRQLQDNGLVTPHVTIDLFRGSTLRKGKNRFIHAEEMQGDDSIVMLQFYTMSGNDW